MKKTIILSIFVGIFVCFGLYSQIESNRNASDSDLFGSQENELNLLSGLSFIPQVSQEANINGVFGNATNSVLITQVGFDNKINSQTKSDFSNIEFLQNGDSNYIDIYINAPNISENIAQFGNNNTVNDIIYYSNLDVQMDVVQNGNNLSLNRIGVNSLTNKIKLVQEGNFKTITIISN